MAMSKQKLLVVGSASMGACAYASFSPLKDGIDQAAEKYLPESWVKWVPSSFITGAFLVGIIMFYGDQCLRVFKLEAMCDKWDTLSTDMKALSSNISMMPKNMESMFNAMGLYTDNNGLVQSVIKVCISVATAAVKGNGATELNTALSGSGIGVELIGDGTPTHGIIKFPLSFDS